MELGCFLAGALLSTQGHMVTTEVIGCIEPVRDFLAIIFFASIGQTQHNNLCYHHKVSLKFIHCSRLYWSLVVVFLCRPPRVSNVCALRTHHSASTNALPRRYEGTALFTSLLHLPDALLALFLFFSQFMMAVLVLSVILPPGSRHIRWIVSAGLAQVSEFSFVLSSRARRAGIISREVSIFF